MGSGITQNIAVSKPNLIKAVVLYGPVSNNEYENFEQFQVSKASRSTRVHQVLGDYGTAEENPSFWGGVSSRSFIESIEIPFKIFTGTADADTPTLWAQNIAQDLRNAGKNVDIVSYP
jgi:pimeloyl-ACP methyl ester carboxylesterase